MAHLSEPFVLTLVLLAILSVLLDLTRREMDGEPPAEIPTSKNASVKTSWDADQDRMQPDDPCLPVANRDTALGRTRGYGITL